jgi:hypothetical protein
VSDATKDKATPQGIVAIYTDKAGHVIATVSDFDRSGYGGFKTWQAQQIRCSDAIGRAVVRAYCSDPIVNHIDNYIVEQIMRALHSKKAGTVTFLAVGWFSDEIDEELRSRSWR